MAAFSPDGRYLGTLENRKTAVIRETRTGGRVVQRIREYEGDRMIGLAWSPDARSLVTGGRRAPREYRDKAVLLWRLRASEERR